MRGLSLYVASPTVKVQPVRGMQGTNHYFSCLVCVIILDLRLTTGR